MIVSLHSVDIILRKDSDQSSFSQHFLPATSGPMQIVVNVVNRSGPFLFLNKNVQPSPAHWRQHFILRLGALAAAPPSGPVNIVNRERTVVVSMTVQTHQVHSRTQASASFTTQMHPTFFYSNPPCWYLGPTSFSTYSQLTTELHNFFWVIIRRSKL